ncbi:CPBP family intramembrane glutamic endopeptidase [Paenibacillus sp. S-12]|uniref:CPBP family intramembrane glutamic endopeptidase n=1 Tax=Paenibacillus sp. S-12 TaxID=3031371 RepID=UPI0025A036B7|nr:CPBP family intramembrane glutamic endopeptidase [Paenibacillus sp. S-12]
MSYISKPLLLASVAGFLLFLIVQVFIPFQQTEAISDSTTTQAILTKEEAARKALTFVQNLNRHHISMTTEPNIAPTVVYRSQPTVSGYISKEKLASSFQKWEPSSPYDTYQVLLNTMHSGRSGVMCIDVHMTSGRIIGFEFKDQPSSAASLGWVMGNQAGETSAEEEEPVLDAASRKKLADALLKHMGWNSSQLKHNESSTELDTVSYFVPEAHVGQAALNVKAVFSQDRIVMLKPFWSIPHSYQAEELHQTKTASSIYNIGYRWMTILLSACSLIACIVYRRDLKFGSKTLFVLTAVSCGISLLHVWNALPGLFALELQITLDSVNMGLSFAIQGAVTVIQGVILYFSIHAGKRAWALSAYRDVLPTWSNTSFGSKLVQALWIGIAYSGVLLGLQTVIFFILESGFHAWSSTDASQSPINLRIAPLFPLLAWVAAISEEGVYRLFGVGLLNRWLRNPWLAGILPTLIWAFGHVTYPIYPYYSRPVELLFIGMLFLFIMLKHGWWTAMFAHLMLDNCLMSLSFLLDGTMKGFIIGFVYLISPIAIVYILAKMHHNHRRSTYRIQWK